MTPGQRDVVQAINDVNSSTGFAYLDNIGISEEDLEQWFQASKTLFTLTQEHKSTVLQQLDPEHNVGYSPVGQENLNTARGADLKESFNVRCPGANTFAGCPNEFVTAAESLWDKADVAMRRLCLACALALNVELDFFSRRFQSMDQVTARFLHYPPCDFDATATAGTGAIRIGEHTDFGLFTLLFMDGPAEGLEIQKVEGGDLAPQIGDTGSWTPVIGRGGATFVVNTGALFARWTNDHWRATAHRVVVPTAAIAAEHRYSIAIFCDPDSDTDVVVDPRFLADGEEPKYPPITAGEYVLLKLLETNSKPL
jgi:isopenicillin N synthase-like dioxygenase